MCHGPLYGVAAHRLYLRRLADVPAQAGGRTCDDLRTYLRKPTDVPAQAGAHLSRYGLPRYRNMIPTCLEVNIFCVFL